MSYEVRLTASFRRSVKKLKRRYPHIQDDESQTLYLLFVYSKSDLTNVTQRELKKLFDQMGDNYKGETAIVPV